jgi:hypothetical protein
MCTTGAKILRPGREFLLFKNRDFRRAHFDDRLSLNEHAFGALGLETWDGDDPNADRFSGFSMGFNAHLACCDSNVKTVPNGDNYDKLVQAVVENSTTIDQAIACVRELVQNRTFCWANMVVATTEGVAALEVRDHLVEVERHPVMVVRSNHHVCLGATPDDDDTTSTQNRFQCASEGLKTVKQAEDLFGVLRSHEPHKGGTVCNHSQYDTVYSYIVHFNDGKTTLYACQGHPCEGEYIRLPVQLGAGSDLSAYPTNWTFTSDSAERPTA